MHILMVNTFRFHLLDMLTYKPAHFLYLYHWNSFGKCVVAC